jgi:hypothetical protein
MGEIKTNSQYYQKQFAQTIARLMGYVFKANQPIADGIAEVMKK